MRIPHRHAAVKTERLSWGLETKVRSLKEILLGRRKEAMRFESEYIHWMVELIDASLRAQEVRFLCCALLGVKQENRIRTRSPQVPIRFFYFTKGVSPKKEGMHNEKMEPYPVRRIIRSANLYDIRCL